MRNKINVDEMLGKLYGRLTVVKSLYYKGNHDTKVLCNCACGKENVKVKASYLIRGNAKSCGCLKVEATIKRSTKHGFAKRGAKSDEYKVWEDMHKRCNDIENEVYGGKGITVCSEWSNFQFFLKDMGLRPNSKSSIERLDNSKGYSKENCVWRCRSTQSAHREKQKNNTSGAIGVIFHRNNYIAYVAWKGKKKEFYTKTFNSAVILRDMWIIYNNLPHTLNVSSDVAKIIEETLNNYKKDAMNGNWNIISCIIEETLVASGHKVIVYKLK